MRCKRPKPWRIGEATNFAADWLTHESDSWALALPTKGPWDQPCGEALVDWPAFSAYLIDPRSKRK